MRLYADKQKPPRSNLQPDRDRNTTIQLHPEGHRGAPPRMAGNPAPAMRGVMGAWQVQCSPGGIPTQGAQHSAASEPAAGGRVRDAALGGPGERSMGSDGMYDVVRRGVAGSGGSLPHADIIQGSFGSHDIRRISAHIGGHAAEASRSIGAAAYTIGDSVAFA